MAARADNADAMKAGVPPLTTLITTVDQPEAQRFDFWRESLSGTFLGLDCLPNSKHSFFGEVATTRIKEVSFSRVRGRGFKYLRTPHWVRQDRERGVFIPLVLKGTCVIAQDGREATLRPGDLTCFDSARPYTGGVSDDFEQLFIHMPHEAWIKRIGPSEQVTARTVEGNTYMGGLVSNFLRHAIPGIGTVSGATADRLAELSLALVTTALGNLISQRELNQSPGRVALLYRAKMLIEDNLQDPGFNPEKIARALGISERYLQDLFHEENITVCNWGWQRRLDKCRLDLSDPLLAGKSVSQIAFNYGFSDLSHFSRRFKAAFSMTPSEFRREQLGGKARMDHAASVPPHRSRRAK